MKRMEVLLGSLLVIAVLSMVAACSTPSPSPSPTTSVSAGVAPSKAEVIAATKMLLKSLPRIPVKGMAVEKIERDANGRWLATVYTWPPPSDSSWPLYVVVAKNADGWQIVSIKSDETAY